MSDKDVLETVLEQNAENKADGGYKNVTEE